MGVGPPQIKTAGGDSVEEEPYGLHISAVLAAAAADDRAFCACGWHDASYGRVDGWVRRGKGLAAVRPLRNLHVGSAGAGFAQRLWQGSGWLKVVGAEATNRVRAMRKGCRRSWGYWWCGVWSWECVQAQSREDACSGRARTNRTSRMRWETATVVTAHAAVGLRGAEGPCMPTGGAGYGGEDAHRDVWCAVEVTMDICGEAAQAMREGCHGRKHVLSGARRESRCTASVGFDPRGGIGGREWGARGRDESDTCGDKRQGRSVRRERVGVTRRRGRFSAIGVTS
ncbi:hypothetical protein C8J57DRAFT_1240115 [Mycena rebaudengoi]|nr:hypothetical protein C8J57DRAFT_1240115 [Mycena rebaudengoi]